MYSLRSLALLALICLLHLFALSYGQDQPSEGNDGEEDPPTRKKRPILRKIIILVGLAIGLAFLAWCLHKTYKAYCRWSRNRRQKKGRKELDDMMEEEERRSSMRIKKEDLGATGSGKYVPLSSVIAEEEPLMHPNVDGSAKRASQPGKNDAPSTPLLEDVPLDDSDQHRNQPYHSTGQGGHPSAPSEEEIVIQVD